MNKFGPISHPAYLTGLLWGGNSAILNEGRILLRGEPLGFSSQYGSTSHSGLKKRAIRSAPLLPNKSKIKQFFIRHISLSSFRNSPEKPSLTKQSNLQIPSWQAMYLYQGHSKEKRESLMAPWKINRFIVALNFCGLQSRIKHTLDDCLDDQNLFYLKKTNNNYRYHTGICMKE